MLKLNKRQPQTPSTVEVARDSALARLETLDPATDKDAYEKVANHIRNLNEHLCTQQPEKLNPNTVALIAGNCVITLVIVGYEQKHVIATKAKDLWLKLS